MEKEGLQLAPFKALMPNIQHHQAGKELYILGTKNCLNIIWTEIKCCLKNKKPLLNYFKRTLGIIQLLSDPLDSVFTHTNMKEPNILLFISPKQSHFSKPPRPPPPKK